MQRRDIREVRHEGDQWRGAYTEFVCESREITVSEYEMLQGIREISTEKAIDEYTMQLVEQGVL